MDTISRAFALTALAVAIPAALVGCGNQTVAGSAAPAPAALSSAPPAPATTAVPGQEARHEVEAVFHRHYEALLIRDFATACALTAPETTDQFLASVRSRGATVGTCEEAWAFIYEQPNAPQQLDAIARSATVRDVLVNGDTATITWTVGSGGQRPTARSALRRIDGEWKMADTAT